MGNIWGNSYPHYCKLTRNLQINETFLKDAHSFIHGSLYLLGHKLMKKNTWSIKFLHFTLISGWSQSCSHQGLGDKQIAWAWGAKSTSQGPERTLFWPNEPTQHQARATAGNYRSSIVCYCVKSVDPWNRNFGSGIQKVFLFDFFPHASSRMTAPKAKRQHTF